MANIKLMPTNAQRDAAEMDFHHVMSMKQAARETREPLHRIRYAYEMGYIVSLKWGHYIMLSRSSVFEWHKKVKRLEKFPMLEIR